MKNSQKNLITRFERELKKNGLIQKGDIIYVALSGGPDSVCLFDLLDKLKGKLGFDLRACHYNHKIRGKASDRDEEFVVKLCRDRGVNLIKESFRGKKVIKNELEAREVRYAFFENFLEKARGAKLAIAHNCDDLAETLIFRLVRGSGPRGIKSIPQVRGKFIRPLLNFEKNEILKYLKSEGLNYCLDATNDNTKYKRNYIRHFIVPGLQKINPKATLNIRKFAKLVEEQNDFVDKIVEKEYKRLAKYVGKKIKIDLKSFQKLEKVVKSNLLTRAALALGYDKDINLVHIDSILAMIEKNEGRKYLTLPHSLRVEIKNGKIYLS